MKFLHKLMVSALAFVAAPASAGWVEASSDHFVVVGDMSEGQAREWAAKLERLDRLLRIVTHAPQEPVSRLHRVNVYVVPDMGSVQKMIGRANVGGFYHGNMQSFTAVVPKSLKSSYVTADQVLFHEYTHHVLLSNTTGYYPDWISEGFAEYFGTAMIRPDGSVLLGTPPEMRGWALGDQYQMTVPELLDASETSRKEGDVEHLYARGWLLVHLLLNEKSRSGQLEKYLAGMDRGLSSLDAGRAAFGDLGKLDDELYAYARSARFQGIVVPADKLPIGAISVRTMRPCEAKIMPARILSANGVNEQTAPRVAAAARAASAGCESDPWVMRTLIETEHDAGNLDASSAEADRLLAIDPTNIMALIYKAWALEKKNQFAEARKLIIRANRADPSYALPLYAYFDSFGLAKEPVPKVATDGLLRAVMLVPQDATLRFAAARALVGQNDLATARIVLLPIAHMPEKKADKEIGAIVAMMDAKADPKAIGEAMDKLTAKRTEKEKKG